MRATGARIVAVVSRGRLEGVIYRSSLILLSSTKTEALARDVMVDPPFTITPETPVGEAVRLMLDYDEWYALAVDSDGRYHGALGLEGVISYALEKASGALEEGRVEDIMTREVLTVTPDDFISRVWRLMSERKYAGLPVVDAKGRLVGIITQYDLIRKGYSRIEVESESGARRGPRVREAMTTGVTIAYPWHTVREVAELMVSRGFGRIPVIDDPKSRRLMGIVDREDVVRFIAGL